VLILPKAIAMSYFRGPAGAALHPAGRLQFWGRIQYLNNLVRIRNTPRPGSSANALESRPHRKDCRPISDRGARAGRSALCLLLRVYIVHALLRQAEYCRSGSADRLGSRSDRRRAVCQWALPQVPRARRGRCRRRWENVWRSTGAGLRFFWSFLF